MSTTPTDVNAAPSPAAPEQSYEQLVNSFQGKERDLYLLKGADAVLAERERQQQESGVESAPPAEQKQPAAEIAETETASGPDETEQPKENRQDRNWREVRKQLAARDAQIELLQRQLADSRQSAPTTPKGEAPKSGAMKRPRLNDPKYDVENGVELYEADRDKYDEWVLQQVESRVEEKLSQREAKHAESQRQQSWVEQIESAKSELKDFEKIAFSDKTPASFSMIERMQAHRMGAKIAYYWGQNPELAGQLAQKTDLPGIRTDQDYAAFLKKADTDPKAAKLLARAEALVDAELDRISESLSSPQAAPLKQKQPLPKPTKDIDLDGRASPVVDELEDAMKRGDTAKYIRLANERDVRRVR